MRLLAVNYHYFRETYPRSGISGVTGTIFTEHISRIQSRWTLADQTDLLSVIDGSATGDLCIITFDDGLKEQMQAAKWLIERGLSAIFFVSTSPLANGRAIGTHKLQLVRSIIGDETLAKSLSDTFGSLFFGTDNAIASAQYRYDSQAAAAIKYFLNFILPSDERGKIINKLFSEVAGDERAFVNQFYMTADDIRLLARHDMLGTHGHAHLPLATLQPDDVRNDILASLDVLRSITGNAMASMSYPYGGSAAVSVAVAKAAADCGLICAFTMNRAINEGTISPHLLHRIDSNDLRAYV